MSDAPLTALTISCALAVGLVMALLGTVKLALARRPDQADVRVRRLLWLLNLLLIPIVIAAGLLVDELGVKQLLIGGSVVLALAFLALSAGLNYNQTIWAVGAAAMGAAALHVATIVLLPLGLFGQSEVAASFQLGMVFFALGALILPPLFDLLMTGLGRRRTMALLAFLFLMPAFLAALVPNLPAAKGLVHLPDLFTDPAVLMAGAVFFLYAPVEAFISVWTTAYLGGGDTREQSRALAGFWGAMLVSRLIFALILYWADLRDGYPAVFLVVPAILSAIILGNLSGMTGPHKAFRGLIMLGLFLGPVFPMLLAMLFKMGMVEEVQGSAYALLYVFGSMGSLALSPLVRLSVSRATIQAALRIPVVLALALAATTLLFALLASARQGVLSKWSG